LLMIERQKLIKKKTRKDRSKYILHKEAE